MTACWIFMATLAGFLVGAYLAERLKTQASQCGARVWVNGWIAEIMPADVPVPSSPIKHIVPGRRWPTAAEGDIVEIDGVLHKVVVNTTTSKTGHQCQFAIYVVIPA
jgi:hypothetical protein